jgi:catechol 2,3-dioxygenase-like lactoylglutathione lyase family enzyme
MQVHKLAWLGTRTGRDAQTAAFFRDVLGLRSDSVAPGFWVLTLPDGSKVEVFGPESRINPHFTTGPVAGFLVDDVAAATAELRAVGVEILLEGQAGDNAWVHFPRAGRQHLRAHPRPGRIASGLRRSTRCESRSAGVRPTCTAIGLVPGGGGG